MFEFLEFRPEGTGHAPVCTSDVLHSAQVDGRILTGEVNRCDAAHNLHLEFPCGHGIIPREDAVAPWISGSSREIALLSCVGKEVSFVVQSMETDADGMIHATLSRRAAQEKAFQEEISFLTPGSILPARVTHMESFGAFLDIGCGIIAMLPTERISVSRIFHPSERLKNGSVVPVIVSSVDLKLRRIGLSHKELLGSWAENASQFEEGETVSGIVRSVLDYGCFVELTPNLSGLADKRPNIVRGDRVSVFIKQIQPERMKIKLQIIDRLSPKPLSLPLTYAIQSGHIDRWVYSPAVYEKDPVETIFTTSP